ncbi:amidohydrolase family protein [Novosphingobium sp. KN65.2]|uniref:N-acyl-D-amino-acid deacylase family protein n=1 Tax=Novosphingobium sp. KN65.2 TaxID=1478134 RepID=UPI001E3C251E|nr:amidohydrolase family protein [Novosphingobium sp. KN65.2]
MDGSGGAAFAADVAVREGVIVAVGEVEGAGEEEIDARGLIVTPGFIDVHTHMDGQVTWGHETRPVSDHGVTTLLMGNCGVGFAPCRPEERHLLLDLMEGVEDIPEPVMAVGIPWAWETYPEYLDFIASRTYDVDICSMVPHAAVRIYAMGSRGASREPARLSDAMAMAAIVKEGMEAGAFGISTTRSLNNRSKDGTLAPTITAREDELMAMACAMGEVGRGIIEVNDQWLDMDEHGRSAEFEMIKRIGKASGRPFTFAVLQQEEGHGGGWEQIFRLTDAANAEGVAMRPQICTRPIGIMAGLDVSLNPFMFCPTWQRELEHLPLEQKVARMGDPEVRAKLLSEEPETTNPLNLWLARTVERMSEMGDPPNYAPEPEDFLPARAAREGRSVLELAYDLMLKNDGRNLLYHPVVNYAKDNLDHIPVMIRNGHSVIGLGDGGAHVGVICDASLPTHLLTYWARDRSGEKLELPEAVRILTKDNADFVGLTDRGLVRAGFRADINIIDFERLHLHAPRAHYDLPAGSRRLLQKADGYVATIKSGVITYRDGEPTGKTPGRLLRSHEFAQAV